MTLEKCVGELATFATCIFWRKEEEEEKEQVNFNHDAIINITIIVIVILSPVAFFYSCILIVKVLSDQYLSYFSFLLHYFPLIIKTSLAPIYLI